MKHQSICFLSLLLYLNLFIACGEDSEPNPLKNDHGVPSTSRFITQGFGVSGLLFENNLIMWERDSKTGRSEFFSQMYFTRTDAPNFPVFGEFPIDQISWGGVPRDGIPALTSTRFVVSDSPELSYLEDHDLILGMVFNSIAKAYPEKILWYHEVVNDMVAGIPVIVSFCPLTGSGLACLAPSEDQTVEQMELLPIVETTWSMWKKMYPETLVMSEKTGYSNRDYRQYPYGNYRDEHTLPRYPIETNALNTAYPPKHPVLGIFINQAQKAYPFAELADNPVINDDLNGTKIVVVSDLTSRMAIAYDRTIDGQTFSFTQSASDVPSKMIDQRTGSIWNLKGEAISGPMRGKKLKQIAGYNAFWFAWSTFWPESSLYKKKS